MDDTAADFPGTNDDLHPSEPTELADPTEPAPVWSEPTVLTATPAPSVPTTASGNGFKKFLAGAALGALIGGAVGGGVATVITDDSPTPANTGAQPAALPLLDDNSDVRDIVVSAGPSVVAIQTQTISLDSLSGAMPQAGAGSGFIISADGLIVTNNHVIDDASEIKVIVADGREFAATVIARDPSRDLAVLRVQANDLPALPLGSSSDLVVGDDVVAIGNALGLGDTPTVTTGIVSALGRTIAVGNGESLTDLVQTDAAINPGNSGGPLLNSRGEVIGINTAIAGGAENIGFAIAIDSVSRELTQLESGEIPLRPFLGVETVPVDADLARQLNLATESGAIVLGVTAGSAADNAGLVRGDVIVGLAGQTVRSSVGLGEVIAGLESGDNVILRVERNRQIIELDTTIGERAGTL